MNKQLIANAAKQATLRQMREWRDSGGITLIEAKAARTVSPGDAIPLQRLASAWRGQPGPRGAAEMVLVHRPTRGGPASRVLAPGVRALPWQDFVKGLC